MPTKAVQRLASPFLGDALPQGKAAFLEASAKSAFAILEQSACLGSAAAAVEMIAGVGFSYSISTFCA